MSKCMKLNEWTGAWMGGWMKAGMICNRVGCLFVKNKMTVHNTHTQRHKRKVIEDKNAQKFAFAAPPKNKNKMKINHGMYLRRWCSYCCCSCYCQCFTFVLLIKKSDDICLSFVGDEKRRKNCDEDDDEDDDDDDDTVYHF